MKKKLIGIPGYKSESGVFGVGSNHLEYIEYLGATPRILMPDEEFNNKIDGLYLPGGMDVNPASYGEVPSFKTSNQDVFKQYFFDNRLKNYVGKIPIVGVCLGFQMINVFFGGKLKQNLLYHPQSKDRMEEGHKVKLYREDGKFQREGGKLIELPVNCHHHQGVTLELLSKELTPLAVYDEVRQEIVVEAYKHKTLPIALVQWHPEEWFDYFTENLFKKTLGIEELIDAEIV